MNTKIEQRDPNDLRGHIHPALKLIPELDEAAPEFLAIAAGVGKCGIIQPLLVDEQGRILDDHSRTLLRCALRWQRKSVPVNVRASEDVHLLIIHSLAHRRHLSKSAIAYLAYPHLQPAFEIARANKLAKLAKNPENAVVASADYGAKTVEDLGKELGIERSMLFEAKKVHELFADKKVYTFNVRGGATDGDNVEMTLRAWFEPKLLQAFVGGEHEQNRPLGLGGIIAGITAVKEGDKSKFAPKMSQGDFFADLFTRDLQKFNKLTDSRRSAALAVIEKSAAELPPEECDAAADTMFEMGRIYRDAANKAKAEPRHGKGASRIGETK